MPRLTSRCLSAAFVTLWAVSGMWPPRFALAQPRDYVGPSQCIKCHKEESAWWNQKDGPPPHGHINALKQLETPKANDFVKAIGLQDKYDRKGACVQCHATVFAGDANAGVSCEKCHGAASGYLDVHAEDESHAKAVAAGMADLVGKPPNWARVCLTCHISTDVRLISAGHPSGDDFDLGVKFGPVSGHFKSKYTAANVGAIGRQQAAGILANRRGTPPQASPARAPGPPSPPVEVTTANTIAPPPTTAAAPSAAAATTLPTSLSAAVALVQGRLVATLTQLLQRGAVAPAHTSTPLPALPPYSGPDAALLELQREAIRLALETLAVPPTLPTAPQR